MRYTTFILLVISTSILNAQDVEVTAKLLTPVIQRYEIPVFEYEVENRLDVPITLDDIRGKTICEHCVVRNSEGVQYLIKPVSRCGTDYRPTQVKPGQSLQESQPLNELGERTAFGWRLPVGEWEAVFGLNYTHRDGDSLVRIRFRTEPVTLVVEDLPLNIRDAVYNADKGFIAAAEAMEGTKEGNPARQPHLTAQLDTMRALLDLSLPEHLYFETVENCIRAAHELHRYAVWLDVAVAALNKYPDHNVFVPHPTFYTPGMLEKHGKFMRQYAALHPGLQSAKWFTQALEKSGK